MIISLSRWTEQPSRFLRLSQTLERIFNNKQLRDKRCMFLLELIPAFRRARPLHRRSNDLENGDTGKRCERR